MTTRRFGRCFIAQDKIFVAFGNTRDEAQDNLVGMIGYYCTECGKRCDMVEKLLSRDIETHQEDWDYYSSCCEKGVSKNVQSFCCPVCDEEYETANDLKNLHKCEVRV